ncbi:general receptor for phosphoinositides 1-associated scaffold protein isoform X2 [Astyanax mexicanus]|uniref:General receptor for phosphoinositides 1-associated scaffold protein isoform X2 n=1 Tax=Astyanax mexicanus TaxID=7994 RepID=A0A8B9HPH4_ASTMX|nr:general receptor for phosphoinositides 1-associated scaffold protein isoform X2 [Astyanax mexicanus]
MKNMTFRRIKKLNSSEPDGGSCPGSGDIYFSSSKSDSCRNMERPASSSDIYNYKTLAYSGGTLPRNFKKNGGLQKWKPLTLPPEPERKVVVLEKKEDESFGFEIQTYGLHHQDENSVEMCTFVCRVHEDSPAKTAGLKVGDTIASVNDASVEGFRHKDIVQLIRSSGNTIRLETVYSDTIRKAELEARLQYLKQTLHEKWDEYRSLMVQEQRLVHGIVMSDTAVYESLESAGVYGSLGAPSPVVMRALRCTGTGSTNSSISHLSSAAGDDDPLYQTCIYQGENGTASKDPSDTSSNPGEASENRLQSGRHRLLRPASELFASAKTSLTRSASTRSYMRGSSSAPGAGEKQQCGGFSSLQRKPKQKSFRRRLLKYIPGLNRPLEEEESKL